VPECQKIKDGLEQYGDERFGRLIFATIRKSVELKRLNSLVTDYDLIWKVKYCFVWLSFVLNRNPNDEREAAVIVVATKTTVQASSRLKILKGRWRDRVRNFTVG